MSGCRVPGSIATNYAESAEYLKRWSHAHFMSERDDNERTANFSLQDLFSSFKSGVQEP